MKKKLLLSLVSVLILIGVLIFLLRFQNTTMMGPPVNVSTPLPTSSPISSPSPSSASKATPMPLPKPSHSGSHSSKNRDQAWKEFTENFGSDLVPQFSPRGELVSVQGKLGANTGSSGFQPDNPRVAIARAREILHAAAPLIGLRSEWPLENAMSRGSQISTQVFFSQTHDGVQIAPGGTVRIDLGPHGELVSLSSSYISDISIVNQIRISSDDARQKVIQLYQNPDATSVRVDGGGKVIWVTGNTGHYAYQFITEGNQIVIDSQTGEVLFSKNMRHY